MYAGKSSKSSLAIITVTILFAMVAASFLGVIGTSEARTVDTVGKIKGSGDLDFSGLEALGYRPRFAYPGAEKIQTPEPIPEGAVYPPDDSSVSTMSSTPTRYTWDEYYLDNILTVYVDVSSSGGGQLSSNEQQLLDRYISDFVNYSYPRVKDWFDPLDKITEAIFYVHQIDGSSGVGGYYSPGTDEFHVDRADLSWAGVITAHEFQHYVHRQYDAYENLWVDEGCADYAAYLIYDISSATAGHVYAYLEYRPYYGLVVTDQTFYQDGSTAYYGISFLYQIYMAEQYGGKNWTRALVSNTNRGTTGVTRALASLGSSDDFMDSFNKWMVATRLNSGDVGSGEYAYPQQSYPYGSLRSGITKTHSGIPVQTNRDINGYSITTLRFTSPPSGVETFRLKLTYSSGTPMVAFYPETASNKDVTFLDFGGSKSITYDFTNWGETYNAFQLIFSSTGYTNVAYDLDVLDLEPPISTITTLPRYPDGIDGWFVTPPKITLQTESGSFIKYQIDSGIETEYSEPFWMPEGVHSLSYWSYDRHNNMEEKNLAMFKVDTEVPSSSIDVQPNLPEENWYTSAPLITLSTSHPDTLLSYKWGNDEFQAYDGAFLAPEGENVLYWKATDQAGNQEDVRSRSFKLDTVAPHVSYVIYPSEPNGEDGWYVTNPQVTLNSYDAAGIYFAIGNGDLQPYLAPFNIPQGENTLRITCTDAAGNDAQEIRLHFSVDTIEPTLEGFFDGIVYTPENSSRWVNVPPILMIEGSENSMQINYTINDGQAISYETPIEIPEGENEIWVRGKDTAGNTAESLFYLVKVDKRVPFIEHSFTEQTVNGWFLQSRASIVLEPKNEDNRSSPLKVYYRWGSESESVYKGPIDMLEGISSFSYWAEDMAGNEMEPRTIQVKKDSTLPLIFLDVNGLNDNKVQVGQTITIDLTGSSDASGIQAYSVDYYNTGVLDWTPNGVFEKQFEEPGTYEVIVNIMDAAGNIVNQSFTVVVEKTDQAPVDGNGESGMDTGLLFIVIGVGATVILLVVALGVVLVVVRSKQAAQQAAPVNLSGTQVPPHRPRPGLPDRKHAPAMPPKPPVQPLPPGK